MFRLLDYQAHTPPGVHGRGRRLGRLATPPPPDSSLADGESKKISLMILRMWSSPSSRFAYYGFGTALNDLLDARRDPACLTPPAHSLRRIGPHVPWSIAFDPLDEPRSSPPPASPSCTYQNSTSVPTVRVRNIVPLSFFFALTTAALIVFYNATPPSTSADLSVL